MIKLGWCFFASLILTPILIWIVFKLHDAWNEVKQYEDEINGTEGRNLRMK